MKKYILTATLVAAITAIAAININKTNKHEGMSDLALANVEALAKGESGSGEQACYNTYTHSPGLSVRRCDICDWLEDHEDTWYAPKNTCNK